METDKQLYSGKAKTLFETDDRESLIMYFRDDTSAFDGRKVAQLARKGMINNRFNAFIMQKLAEEGIPTHFVHLVSDKESLVKRLDMIPLECVVRNIAAGSLCRRLGISEGRELDPPVFEIFLKNDALHDPLLNEYHILTFGWATEAEIQKMKQLTFQVNQILKQLFLDACLLLVDYKLEFGRHHGSIVLGDEFTPDGCRLWDAATREKLDKDRFRQELGGVTEAYEDVARRLGVDISPAA